MEYIDLIWLDKGNHCGDERPRRGAAPQPSPPAEPCRGGRRAAQSRGTSGPIGSNNRPAITITATAIPATIGSRSRRRRSGCASGPIRSGASAERSGPCPPPIRIRIQAVGLPIRAGERPSSTTSGRSGRRAPVAIRCREAETEEEAEEGEKFRRSGTSPQQANNSSKARSSGSAAAR